MKIMAPSPKLKADMKQVGAIMLNDWEKRAGPDGQAVVAAFRKTAELQGRRRSSGRPAFTPACGNTAQTTSPGLFGATASSFLAWPTSMSRGSVTPFFTARISAMTLTAISGGVLLPM